MKRLLLVLLAAALLVCPAMAGAETLRLAMDADPVSLDPHVQLSGGMLQYSHMVYDPLVRWTKAMDFEPRLAEKWERLDPLTLRFFLRKGVKFHFRQPLYRQRTSSGRWPGLKKARISRGSSSLSGKRWRSTTTPSTSKPTNLTA